MVQEIQISFANRQIGGNDRVANGSMRRFLHFGVLL